MSHDNEVAERAQPAPSSEPSVSPVWLAMARGVVGGALGGVLGYFGFFWLLDFGLYALVLPGALVGLGAGFAAGRRLLILGLLCALGAGLVGALADWHSLAGPNESFWGHVAEYSQRRQQSLLLLVGVAIAFYLGIGRNR